MDVDASTREALEWRCKAIRTQWQTVLSKSTNSGSPQVDSVAAGNDADQAIASLASEVLVFPRAVELALEFGQFYRPRDLEAASELLDEAARRITIIENGGRWADVVGIRDVNDLHTIVGGYESAIDGSYQPYGLVIPRGMRHGQREPLRLDLWFHGRGEKLSEVAFLSQQRDSTGEYTPDDTLVLHPYGRYSNAFKFAGEMDVLEVLDYVKRRLPIDEDRVSVRGFSMGGAACWQFATHYADRWFAANPGAGFSETPEFLAFFQSEEVRDRTPWYQQELWQLYDCPPWSRNLLHCPTIAYSGELDRQKQAADVMASALANVGIDLVHVIGPQTAHKIHEASKIEIESRMSQLARRACGEAPDRIEFTTVSLRYHRMHWIEVRGLVEHWTPAKVSATRDDTKITVTTDNVSRIRFDFGPGQWTGNPAGSIQVEINGQALQGPLVRSDRSWRWELERFQDQWRTATDDGQLRKRPRLQGPIDDAFMDTFLFVLPSGKSSDAILQDWIDSEALHAMLHWRKHFRGDIRQKLDRDVTETDLASSNLILFGDIETNLLIRRIAPELPVRWLPEKIHIGAHSVPRKGHAALMIYPNPLNEDRYVVLNSGFTCREDDYLNNARQTPKLPDWALVDIREGATTTDPGKVLRAGFFDERWQP